MNKRLDSKGAAVEDWLENPKAVERKKIEAEERARIEAEGLEPWGRAKIERELSRISKQSTDQEFMRTRLNLSEVDLSGQDLSGLDLSGANLHGAKLVGADLSGCRLVGANLSNAIMTGASLEKANAVDANFSSACLCSTKSGKTHFMGANLSDACFEGNVGIDIVEKKATPAEVLLSAKDQSLGARAVVVYDDTGKGGAKVLYLGDTLSQANITGMRSVCRSRGKS
jgi:uncharacterized protein YjbI with pentapeptide repeats